MYQVAWTRRLISVTSATATAQAVVLAVFMVGLGLGAFVAGRRAARLRRPLVGYAGVELAAAAFSLVSFALIDASDGVRGALLALAGPAAVWIQLTLVSSYLLLPTVLMGASLPLLIEHCERSGWAGGVDRGRMVSALYGVNTLGAVLGCWLAGFVTIEAYGLTRTGFVGAAFAVAAAVLALALSGRRRPAGESATVQIPDQTGTDPSIEQRYLVAAFIAGFLGLGAEVLWARQLALIVPNTVYAFSQVLIAVLIGIVLGSLVAGTLARRFAEELDDRRALVLLSCFAALSAVLIALVPVLLVQLADVRGLQQALARGSSLTAALVLLVGFVPASALIATFLPALVGVARARRGAAAFGRLYGANTAGAVLGSLTVGFAFLPGLGVRGTGSAFAAIALGLAWVLVPLRSAGVELRRIYGLALVTCTILHFSHDVPHQIYASRLPEETSILEFREGVHSHVMVTQDSKHRLLWINSSWVATSYGGHRVIGHLPALFVERPRRALGIALGTGQTFASTLEHGVEHFDCVEIDAGVIELSRRWFHEVNGGLLDDPRVHVHLDDGRAFLRGGDDPYDLIVLEPLQAWSAGTSSLYSREFYEDAAGRMSPGAVLAQWIPFYGQGVDETRAMIRTGLEVFAQGSLWLTSNDAVLLLSNQDFEFSLRELEQRIAERGLEEEFARFPVETGADLMVALLLGPDGLRRWVADAPVLEDDRPFLEFRAARAYARVSAEESFRAILHSAQAHMDPLRSYVSDEEPALLTELAIAERVREARVAMRLLPRDDHAAQAALLEQVRPVAGESAVWRRLYGATIERRDISSSASSRPHGLHPSSHR